MSDKIIGRTDDGIGRLIVNNPEKRNAMSFAMWEAVVGVLDRFEADPAVRVIVISGVGEKAFVSGADISEFEATRADPDAVRRYDEVTRHVFDRLERFPKPTLAEITGACVGGGAALAVACDMRIAGEGSRFGIPAAKLGLGYDAEGIRRLMDLVGPAHTKEIFFTARLFSAAEALSMGLVNRVLPDADVEGAANDTARMIAANAPLTIASVKATTIELGKDESGRDLAHCAALVERCFASQDYIEGRTAFLEKRKPRFTGS